MGSPSIFFTNFNIFFFLYSGIPLLLLYSPLCVKTPYNTDMSSIRFELYWGPLLGENGEAA